MVTTGDHWPETRLGETRVSTGRIWSKKVNFLVPDQTFFGLTVDTLGETLIVGYYSETFERFFWKVILTFSSKVPPPIPPKTRLT